MQPHEIHIAYDAGYYEPARPAPQRFVIHTILDVAGPARAVAEAESRIWWVEKQVGQRAAAWAFATASGWDIQTEAGERAVHLAMLRADREADGLTTWLEGFEWSLQPLEWFGEQLGAYCHAW